MVYRIRNDAVVWVLAAMLSLMLLGLILVGPQDRSTLMLALAPMVLLLGSVALLMSSLTVALDDQRLRIWLGPGLLRREYALADIVAVGSVTLSSPFSVGLRLLPDGWLYSLGGTRFIEVRFINSSRLLIGMDSEDLEENLRRYTGR